MLPIDGSLLSVVPLKNRGSLVFPPTFLSAGAAAGAGVVERQPPAATRNADAAETAPLRPTPSFASGATGR